MMEKHLISHLVGSKELATNVVWASISFDLFTPPLVVLISFTLIHTQLCKRITRPQVQNVLKFIGKRKYVIRYLILFVWRSNIILKESSKNEIN